MVLFKISFFGARQKRVRSRVRKDEEAVAMSWRTLLLLLAVVEFSHWPCDGSVGRRRVPVHLRARLRGGEQDEEAEDEEAGIAHMLIEPNFAKARSSTDTGGTHIAFHDFGAADKSLRARDRRTNKRPRNELSGKATDPVDEMPAIAHNKDEYARAFSDLVLPERYCNMRK